MEHVVGLKYAGGGFFDPNSNNGLGEYKAYFVLVKEGHESEAQDKMRAFGSAGVRHATRVRDGVIAMSRKQIDQRLLQLREKLIEQGVYHDEHN